MTNGSRRILVADPDAETRVSLYSALSGLGWLVATLSPGRQALEHVARCKPDLVLSGADPRFAEEAGFLESVRRISPGSRIVLLVAGPAPVAEDGRLFDGQLRRPVRSEALLRMVQRMVPGEAVA